MAYCMSQMPPDGVDSNFEDYVRFAKFQLSASKGVLMEDPIWDKYTDEQIVIEYIANVFTKDKERLKDFEMKLYGQDSEIYDWLDAKVKENQEELAKTLEKMEDSVKFVPDTIGD